jgi:hypothetical protein
MICPTCHKKNDHAIQTRRLRVTSFSLV